MGCQMPADGEGASIVRKRGCVLYIGFCFACVQGLLSLWNHKPGVTKRVQFKKRKHEVHSVEKTGSR